MSSSRKKDNDEKKTASNHYSSLEEDDQDQALASLLGKLFIQRILYETIPREASEDAQTDKTLVDSMSHFESIVGPAIQKFGEESAIKLSMVGAIYNGENTYFSGYVVDCQGTIQGKHTLPWLFSRGHIAHKKEADDDARNNIVYLTNLAHKFAWTTFFLLVVAQEEELLLCSFHKKLDSGLPIPLQYNYADVLPMGEKARKVHINWCIQYCKTTNTKFDGYKYMVRMLRSEIDKLPDQVMLALKTIELCIQLNDADKAIGDPKAKLLKHYPNTLMVQQLKQDYSIFCHLITY